MSTAPLMPATKMSAPSWMGLTDAHIQPIGKHHGLVADVKTAFEAMQLAAQKDGIDIQLASSFRSFDRQLAIWQKKWLGTLPINDIHSHPINTSEYTELEKIHAIMTWSALPGASRHHWGTDLDVYDKKAIERCGQPLQLVSAEYELAGPCYELHCWLEENADNFGFYRPYKTYNGGVAPEAWHLSYAPISKSIINQLELSQLANQLASVNIGGKQTILRHLDKLFERYTLNGIIQ
ncbi:MULTISPECIES: M15 family metallopeptidase [Aliiglaciecola]|uniref:M15 family metallopeptidase n=1 Tax=Aliiglaciecola TaxID=1406885 RepID=UPI002091188D|nr:MULTISPECIES: M15 family metallopeptidase [Aliiglaciecola]MDO6712282.1 M15 family metallopeptidase [Aliiglaciecola sp. 2_MG-2023]MDO6753312.1 M15 family metallopeptidase [Aliiglaciecola sp. 1_MG-2023]